MHYQTIGSTKGHSDSETKLRSLNIPDLEGKRFIDIGCNIGFFCGYAHFCGAIEVVGIDKDSSFIERAKNLFPECTFILSDWNDFTGKNYNVILYASAAHYNDNPILYIENTMKRLARDGVLILEAGIVNDDEVLFKKMKRKDDEPTYITTAGIEHLLRTFSGKLIGRSVMQSGDDIERYVYHLYNKAPYAFVFIGDKYSGKTSAASFIQNIFKIHADTKMRDLKNREIDKKLKTILEPLCDKNIGIVIDKICSEGMLQCFLNYMLPEDGKSFIYEGYIHNDFRKEFLSYIKSKGYFIVDCQTTQICQFPAEQCKINEYISELKNKNKLENNHSVTGYLDGATNNIVSGWAFDQKNDEKLQIKISVNQYAVCTVLASIYREDLKIKFNRECAFWVRLNGMELKKGDIISAVTVDGNRHIGNSPLTI